MSKEITLFNIYGESHFNVQPLPMKRSWMNEVVGTNAYQCVPMNIANQSGWVVLNPAEFCATWDGGPTNEHLQVHYHEDPKINFAQSHLHNGTLTIVPDFIIRTPEGISTLVSGVPNYPIPRLTPLQAVIETDWLTFTFTYNFKFNIPGEVIFRKGDPLFTFMPIKRGEIDQYSVTMKPISLDKDLHDEYLEYEKARNESQGTDKGFQRFYSRGKSATKNYEIKNHQNQLKLNDVKILTSEDI
jgi:hypothetical protein